MRDGVYVYTGITGFTCFKKIQTRCLNALRKRKSLALFNALRLRELLARRLQFYFCR